MCSHSDIPLYFPRASYSSTVLDTKCEHSQRFNLFLVKFSGGSWGGARDPLRAEKNVLETAPPYISQGLDAPPPLISRSGSGTEIDPVVTMSLDCGGTFLAALLITPAFLAVICDCNCYRYSGYGCKSVRDGQIATVRQISLATHFNTK